MSDEVCVRCQKGFDLQGVSFLRILCIPCADEMWNSPEYEYVNQKKNYTDKDCYDAVTAWCERTKEKAHRPVEDRHIDNILAEMLGLEKNEVRLHTSHNDITLFRFQNEPLKAVCEQYLESQAQETEFSPNSTVDCGAHSPAVAYLKSIEWNMGCGGDENEGQCNECEGLSPDWADGGTSPEVAGHKRDCKLAAAIPGALYVDEKTQDWPARILIAERKLEATVKEKLKQIEIHGEKSVFSEEKLNQLFKTERKETKLTTTSPLQELADSNICHWDTPACTCGVGAVGGKHSSWCDTERTT